MIGVYATGGREPRHAREREGDPWKRIATVVPRPGALVRPMVPPQLSTSRRAMARPRPDPLAADVLPRVFDPASSTTSRGSGPRLATARRLVQSWGGPARRRAQRRLEAARQPLPGDPHAGL